LVDAQFADQPAHSAVDRKHRQQKVVRVVVPVAPGECESQGRFAERLCIVSDLRPQRRAPTFGQTRAQRKQRTVTPRTRVEDRGTEVLDRGLA
jgi:hypothetical protein